MSESLQPISLGFACDVKYQVSRHLFARAHPAASETDFRNALFRWQGQASPFRRHIFDWAITPLTAVFAYLERDFEGVFERSDLHIDEEAGTVAHRRLGTAFPHDFRASGEGPLTEADIDRGYGAFRDKHVFLAQRFRDLLLSPGPYLYVHRAIVTHADAQRLAGLLGARSPEHRFKLLFVDVEGAVNQVLSGVAAPTFKGWLPPGCDKPAERVWEGPDGPWDAVLGQFDLGMSGMDAPAPPPVPTQTAPARGPAGPPPAGDWSTVLDCEGAKGFLDVFTHVDAGADRYAARDGGLSFVDPAADDHFYCHFLPVALGGGGGWARLSLDWPADGVRASVALQDQDCRHPTAWSVTDTPLGARHRQALVLPLASDVDHIRLVATPGGDGASALPERIRLEIAAAGDPAPPPEARARPWWRRLFDKT